jgi:hypothetical protein
VRITRDSLKTNAGSSDWFRGAVYVDTGAASSASSRLLASIEIDIGLSQPLTS